MRASIDGPTDIVATTGYAARGIVYLIISFFAILAAVGSGDVKDSSGALQSLLGHWTGSLLLLVIAAGLFCYSTLRFMQAILDIDDHGNNLKSGIVRTGLFISCVTHLFLAIAILSWLIVGATSDGDAAKSWSAKLMKLPFGIWLVAAVGVCVAGAGVAHIVKGWTAGFEQWFTISDRLLKWLGPIFQAGLIIRGIIFILIGGFFGLAAWQHNSDKARGFKDTLQMVIEQPFGPYLLGAIALGLCAFSVYSLSEAFFRETNGPRQS